MNREFHLGGVLLSPIVPTGVLALLATIVLSVLLTRLGVYRLTWHRPLVEVSLFCILVWLFTVTYDLWA